MEAQIEEIFAIVSGCLLLGNVDFDPKSKEEAKIVDRDVVVAVAELWKCDEEKLCFCIEHSWKGAKRDILANYTLQQAPRMRDSFARMVYHDLFEEIVRQFSSLLSEPVDRNQDTFLGILDIFGFEFVDQRHLAPGTSFNSFEQFCINLCNEKLQNHFVKCVFSNEIAQYRDEGLLITAEDFEFTPNDRSVELLQGNKHSILQALDEVCKVPSNKGDAGDTKFLETLIKKFNDPPTWKVTESLPEDPLRSTNGHQILTLNSTTLLYGRSRVAMSPMHSQR